MEFETLKDLAKVITRNKIKHIEVLGNPGREKNRVELLYEGLASDKFKTEKEAVRYFFKTYDTKNSSYLKLKNKLVHQLVNTAFFVDTNQASYNERAKAYYTAYKDFAAANILLTRHSGKSGIYMCQLVLEQSIKYEFIELAADSSRFLRRHYSRLVGDYEKNQYYAVLHRKYEEKRRYETLAIDYYETLIGYYFTKRSPNEEIHRLATTYFDELILLAEKVDTSAYYNYTYAIGIIKYLSVNDIIRSLDVCNEALKILEPRRNTNRGALVSLTMQKMAFYTQLRIPNDNSVKEC